MRSPTKPGSNFQCSDLEKAGRHTLTPFISRVDAGRHSGGDNAPSAEMNELLVRDRDLQVQIESGSLAAASVPVRRAIEAVAAAMLLRQLNNDDPMSMTFSWSPPDSGTCASLAAFFRLGDPSQRTGRSYQWIGGG